MLLELRDLELAVEWLALSSRTRAVFEDIRKVAAWLGQQFSGGLLALEYQWKVRYKLDLSVRHDVAVLDVDTTFCCLAKTVVEVD
jgi:hypothetical protein